MGNERVLKERNSSLGATAIRHPASVASLKGSTSPAPGPRTRQQLAPHAVNHVHGGGAQEVVGAEAAVGAALRSRTEGRNFGGS